MEQTDVHLPQSTVGEAVQFSAALRLPAGTPAEEVAQRVEEVRRRGGGEALRRRPLLCSFLATPRQALAGLHCQGPHMRPLCPLVSSFPLFVRCRR